jgi:hypothetical protein
LYLKKIILQVTSELGLKASDCAVSEVRRKFLLLDKWILLTEEKNVNDRSHNAINSVPPLPSNYAQIFLKYAQVLIGVYVA